MQYPAQLFHRHRRESAQIPDYATHKKMEPKWVQDYDLHKSRGEIDWLPLNEVPWKDEFAELEKKALAMRDVRAQENLEKEEMSKIEAKKKELLAKFAEKKNREAMEAEIREMEKELGEKVPVYVAPKPQPKPEPVKVEEPSYPKEEEKPVEVSYKPKKKLFGSKKVDDGS